ncbi:MAG: hypothetical protein R3234_02440 [Thermoanaerobaculia bacterium]|nr:hypothetical protein [Thermoanaerobaculia bacterium]
MSSKTLSLVAGILLAAAPALAGSSSGATAEELQRQIQELRDHYERRLNELERRIRELEAREEPPAPEAVETEEDRELEGLLAAAEEAARGAPEVPEAPPAREPEAGRERALNELNPEISFTGDVVGFTTFGENDFNEREFELDFQSALDPFSITKWTIAFSPHEGVDVEEGYIAYSGLLPGLTLRGGKMRQSFGVLNRWHLHALPQPEYPLVVQSYLGEEGLVQTGLSAEWLLPRPLASANELTLQVMDGSAEPFGGESFDDLTVLGRFKSFWDLSPATYLEWGLSGIVGKPEGADETRIWGTDFTFNWQPPQRAKYREITWRTELLLSERDDPFGERREALGGYSYLEGLVRRNLWVGARYDWLEDPLAPETERWAIEPYVSWWQSEYVRLRAAYRFLDDDAAIEEEDRFLLQITWAAGPHKHEKY